MTPLRERMIQDLQLRNYAESTIGSYVEHVARFARWFGKSPDQLGPGEIRRYLLHLIHERKVAHSHYNVTICALRFLYRVTLARTWSIDHLPLARRPRRLPTTLTPDEVQRLLPCVALPLHRTVLATIYGTGLRVSEALHLQCRDIDSKRMVIHVRRAKRSKERLVPLSPLLLETLRAHWRQTRPKTWLFGGEADRPPHRKRIAVSCRKAAVLAEIPKRVTPHVLRHSFATCHRALKTSHRGRNEKQPLSRA